ncbi:hypothetical protein LguiA_007455 [Lonicera macranthoides]
MTDVSQLGGLRVDRKENRLECVRVAASSNPSLLASSSNGRCQLLVWSLRNLKRVEANRCNKLLYLFPPHMVVSLPVLQSLSIWECDSLRYIFCSSTATSLVQLRYLTITGCEMMEVIVKNEDEVQLDRTSKVEFSSLISIKLRNLPNLKGFCMGVLGFEWPSLKSVDILFCWKLGIFISGYSNQPILRKVFIDSNPHSLEVEDLNTTLMTMRQKVWISSIRKTYDPEDDNLAIKEEGILTINGFLIAGDHLVAQCPSWSWNSGRTYRASGLPHQRQFLITRNVPCLRKASSKEVEEHKNEGDECDGEDKNIPTPRSYDVSITYDKHNRSPRLWLKGYDDKSKMILPLELVLQDIAEYHPRELITIERHPDLGEDHVSLYPLNFIKDFYDRASQGIELNVENYLQILLEAYASIVPTIMYKYC